MASLISDLAVTAQKFLYFIAY